jgi:hypothetical protein
VPAESVAPLVLLVLAAADLVVPVVLELSVTAALVATAELGGVRQ